MTPWAKQKPKAARKAMSKTQKTVMQTEKGMMSLKAVSYTHLDVYKRQGQDCPETFLGKEGIAK